jgi:tRNA threonylcarbamoyladenosine dehydratase
MTDPQAMDFARRFGGVARLHGEASLQAFRTARVCVVGVGGVGSWVVEALARNAVGQLTLIDLDMIAESNTNRQLHALGDAWGRAKVDAMRERVLAINPGCAVRCVEDFLSEDNLAQLLAGHHAVVDAIDNVRVKAAMAAYCKTQNQYLVMCGSAGGKKDPTRLCVADLSRTEQDPLLAKVRSRLRKDYAFPRDVRRKFGIEAVYSTEPVQQPDACSSEAGEGPQGLSCAGYGSDVCVTATAGLFAAARVLAALSQINHSLERV